MCQELLKTLFFSPGLALLAHAEHLTTSSAGAAHPNPTSVFGRTIWPLSKFGELSSRLGLDESVTGGPKQAEEGLPKKHWPKKPVRPPKPTLEDDEDEDPQDDGEILYFRPKEAKNTAYEWESATLTEFKLRRTHQKVSQDFISPFAQFCA
ncbi:hypothetical protein FA13DRAFT_1713513 [Coprinellus micaceus]|uniref:Uncharacterized protein n=1 Tax=Coprinellus micaceus TaxID=71717 RepID=A0A4Y7SW83_COPMI|nr:hypothetical protein FA13DRAFT_1713513 [Coprinellus micaceus]